MPQAIQEKLRKLGILEKNIGDYAEIFSNASTPEEVRREIGRRHYGAGYYQVVGPLFKQLFEGDKQIIEAVHQELAETEISSEIIDEYFTGMGGQPYLIFHLTYEDEIPLEIRERFVEKADKVILHHVRRYLGVE